ENDFLAAEQRMDRLRIDAGVCFETARAKSAPLRVEIDLTDRQFSARSIAPRPARQHKRLRGGEDIIFRIRAPIGGHLSIFNFGTTGDTILIYPNHWQKLGRIQAHEFLDVP